MANKSSDELRLASLLKKGKPFTVQTPKERNLVLAAARFLGVNITTRERKPEAGFSVLFLD